MTETDYSVYDTVPADTVETLDNVILFDSMGNPVPCMVTRVEDNGNVIVLDAETDASLEEFRNYILNYEDDVELWIS